MGTRRSKHNKGRKPLYKDHERTTLADLAPFEADRWEAEAEQALQDRRINAFREARSPDRGYLASRIKKPDPQLTEGVKAYLAKLQAEQARKAAADVFPDARLAPERLASSFDFVREAEQVEPSRRDFLMEMFVERKIGHGQMHAGRRWQCDKEFATLQPCRSIDWSKSLGPYQARGTLTSSQWHAMRRRAQFVSYAGKVAVSFLDLCLEPDRGLTELVKITGISAAHLESTLDRLLTELCLCFGSVRSAA